MESRPATNYLFKPFLGSSHWWALNKLAALPKNCSVLDVGCGRGALGEVMRDMGFAELFAVEIDDEARREAAIHYRQVVATPANLPRRTFDIILLLDVLEHLADPRQFFDEILSFAHEGTMILLSVPNVAHWSLRFALLFGFFEYTSRGLLDETHLSFFTRRRLRQLVGTIPLNRDPDWGASIAPLEFLLPTIVSRSTPFLLFSRLRLTLARLFPGLLAYQHLVYLEVKEGVAAQAERSGAPSNSRSVVCF